MISTNVPSGEPEKMAIKTAKIIARPARKMIASLKLMDDDCNIVNFRSGCSKSKTTWDNFTRVINTFYTTRAEDLNLSRLSLWRPR